MDSPVAAYGKYSNNMITTEPEGITKEYYNSLYLRKEKISNLNEVFQNQLQLIN